MRHLAVAALVSREWRTSWADPGAYLLRGLYSGALLLGAMGAWGTLPLLHSHSPEDYPELMKSFFGIFCRVQFVLATLLSAMTASRAVCREQERGTMDLLILSPLSRMEILLGKLAGDFLGLAALVASGIPPLFLLLPLGGLSAAQILCLQGMVLAQILLVGGICSLLAAAVGRTTPVMLTAWVLLTGIACGPAAGRWWLPSSTGLWLRWESFSIWAALDHQLTSVWAEPKRVLEGLALSLAAAIACCGLGSLVLERRLLRGGGPGIWARWAARVRTFARTLAGQRLFRHLVGIEHPLMLRECAVSRDLPFRMGWILLVALYVAAARYLMAQLRHGAEDHVVLASFGLAAGAAISVLTGALSLGYDRRRGTLQTLLAAGVAPEDLVRARLAGLILRAFYLLALPVLHLVMAFSMAEIVPEPELLWRIPAGLAAGVLATITMMTVTLKAAISYTRPEVSALVAAFLALPLGVILIGLAAGTLPAFAIGFPLAIGGLLGYYAALVRKAPKLILR
jgi:ABC-type Na+ efflux pump permease subunit